MKVDGETEEEMFFFTDAKKMERGLVDTSRIKPEKFWLIASLELLASLVAVKLDGFGAQCWIRGKTVNLGNSYAVAKWMSAKFPLTC